MAVISQSGQLTIIDLSCPCVTPEMACALFNICLSLFLQQPATMGRIIALDEAHKYMTNSADCEILTEALLSTIRLQRHHGARVIVCTQEPTISPKLLDLCSMTIVHRFTSPSWLRALTAHLAGAAAVNNDAHGTVNGEDALTGDARGHDFPARLFSEIVELRTGEALLFAPSALVGVRESPRVNGVNGIMNGSGPEAAVNGDSGGVPVNGNGDAHRSPVELLRLKHGYMKIRVRKRITQDGGRSVMAT